MKIRLSVEFDLDEVRYAQDVGLGTVKEAAPDAVQVAQIAVEKAVRDEIPYASGIKVAES